MNKYALIEIMNSNDTIDADLSLINELSMFIKNDIFVNIVMDEKTNNYLYKANVNDILQSNLQLEDLLLLKSCGWQYNMQEDCLIRKI